MSFYGKIYEQASNIFNKLKFKNISSQNFLSNVDVPENFTLTADGGQACAVIAAGNPWIQFKEDTTERQSDGSKLGCKIYHSLPHTPPGKTGFDETYTECVIQEQERNSELSDFLKLTNPENDTLTDKEKQDLQTLDNDTNLLYFGDTFKTWSPIRDNAGHIVKFDEKTWQIGPLPRILEILQSENRIGTLEDVVGTTGYDLATKGTVSNRLDGLESIDAGTRIGSLEDILIGNDTYPFDKATIVVRVNNLENDFEEAKQATEAVNRIEGEHESIKTKQSEIEEDITQFLSDLGQQNSDIAGIIGALGVTSSSGISEPLKKNTFLDWAKDIEARIGAGGTNEKTIEVMSNGAETLAEWAYRLQTVIGADYNEYDPNVQTNTLSAQIQANADAIAQEIKDRTDSYSELEEAMAEKASASLTDAVGAGTSTEVQDAIGAASLIAWAQSINDAMQIVLDSNPEEGEGSTSDGGSDTQVQSLTSLVSSLWFRMAKLENLIETLHPGSTGKSTEE